MCYKNISLCVVINKLINVLFFVCDYFIDMEEQALLPPVDVWYDLYKLQKQFSDTGRPPVFVFTPTNEVLLDFTACSLCSLPFHATVQQYPKDTFKTTSNTYETIDAFMDQLSAKQYLSVLLQQSVEFKWELCNKHVDLTEWARKHCYYSSHCDAKKLYGEVDLKKAIAHSAIVMTEFPMSGSYFQLVLTINKKRMIIIQYNIDVFNYVCSLASPCSMHIDHINVSTVTSVNVEKIDLKKFAEQYKTFLSLLSTVNSLVIIGTWFPFKSISSEFPNNECVTYLKNVITTALYDTSAVKRSFNKDGLVHATVTLLFLTNTPIDYQMLSKANNLYVIPVDDVEITLETNKCINSIRAAISYDSPFEFYNKRAAFFMFCLFLSHTHANRSDTKQYEDDDVTQIVDSEYILHNKITELTLREEGKIPLVIRVWAQTRVFENNTPIMVCLVSYTIYPIDAANAMKRAVDNAEGFETNKLPSALTVCSLENEWQNYTTPIHRKTKEDFLIVYQQIAEMPPQLPEYVNYDLTSVIENGRKSFRMPKVNFKLPNQGLLIKEVKHFVTLPIFYTKLYQVDSLLTQLTSFIKNFDNISQMLLFNARPVLVILFDEEDVFLYDKVAHIRFSPNLETVLPMDSRYIKQLMTFYPEDTLLKTLNKESHRLIALQKSLRTKSIKSTQRKVYQLPIQYYINHADDIDPTRHMYDLVSCASTNGSMIECDNLSMCVIKRVNGLDTIDFDSSVIIYARSSIQTVETATLESSHFDVVRRQANDTMRDLQLSIDRISLDTKIEPSKLDFTKMSVSVLQQYCSHDTLEWLSRWNTLSNTTGCSVFCFLHIGANTNDRVQHYDGIHPLFGQWVALFSTNEFNYKRVYVLISKREDGTDNVFYVFPRIDRASTSSSLERTAGELSTPYVKGVVKLYKNKNVDVPDFDLKRYKFQILLWHLRLYMKCMSVISTEGTAQYSLKFTRSFNILHELNADTVIREMMYVEQCGESRCILPKVSFTPISNFKQEKHLFALIPYLTFAKLTEEDTCLYVLGLKRKHKDVPLLAIKYTQNKFIPTHAFRVYYHWSEIKDPTTYVYSGKYATYVPFCAANIKNGVLNELYNATGAMNELWTRYTDGTYTFMSNIPTKNLIVFYRIDKVDHTVVEDESLVLPLHLQS